MMNPDSISAQSRRRSPSALRQRGRHDHGAAGLGEQLSDHSAEPNHHRDGSERVAHAGLKRARNIGERHPRRKSDEERRHGERKKRRNAHPGDEQHDKGDANGCDGEKGEGVTCEVFSLHGTSFQSLFSQASTLGNWERELLHHQ